jgi:Tol biopolymer transport system component
MEHQCFGINNNLWIIKKDGTGAKCIWTTDLNHAALHPHFSHDGTKLIFAERVPTGIEIPGIGELTPGGENHWDGWQIRIADFDTETMEIINSAAIKPNGNGFYETNDFYNKEEFTYSFTPNGQAYVDDLYSVKTDGTNVVHIINSPTTWEEHGTFSPAGTGYFVFLSSRFDPTWIAPISKPDTVALELFLKKTNGDIVQLTEMNKNANLNTRCLVSDYDWDKDGKRIVAQVALVNIETGKYSPQIWMIKFKK